MVDLSGILANAQAGMAFALSAEGLKYCFIGVFLGTVVGVLPGIGTMATIALLMPLTLYLDPKLGLIMLAGIYYGAAYGGSTAAILLNIPGTANSAVSCIDGYPMAQQGRAGVALFMTTIASLFGSMFGVIILVVFAYTISGVALLFGPQEYFALILLGLVAVAFMSDAPALRTYGAIILGILLGLIGADVNTGAVRFSFGLRELYDGLSIVAVAIGLFGLPELIRNARDGRINSYGGQPITFASMLPTRDDWRRSLPAMVRGSGVGSFFGILPGTGSLIASFMAYTVERRSSRTPERFGKGAIEGISAPEAANNAAIQTAFVPTLTLGIPGDAVMALMLGMLLMHGITPGPSLLQNDPLMFWGLVASFLVGNAILLVLNLPLIGLWIKLVSAPYRYLAPFILALVCIGVYIVGYQKLDILVVMLFGALGLVFFHSRIEPAPVILGFVLGPMIEEHFRRSLLISRGDFMVFVERPISGTILAICAVLVLLKMRDGLRRRRAAARMDP